MDELEYYNGALTGDEIDKRIVVINCGTISTLPKTVTNAMILAKHIPIGWSIGSLYAQSSDWTITTAAGSLTISGTLRRSTTLTLVLGVPL